MPKRVKNLMPLICRLENLHEAFLRAVRGKSGKRVVITMRQHLDEHLLRIQRQLLDGTLNWGQYSFFEITDQKRRMICAASFTERIAFQAMMRICHPVFDDFQCDCSFASRKGRGTHSALDRAQQLAGRYRWFAKLDVRKFFYSISHEVMLSQLCRLFKDPLLLHHFERIVHSYEASPGRGLPIGNLTSQYFANHYLAVADHWAKEHLGVKGMVRYMDDVLLFADSHEQLMSQVRGYMEFVAQVLLLELHEPIINQSRYGIPFLGYVVYRDRLRLSRRSELRFCRKMLALADELRQGSVSELRYTQRVQWLTEFVNKADSGGFRHHVGEKYIQKGLFPRYPRWKLEQYLC